MGDDFNFFLPDELLNDSDSDGERESGVPPAPGLARLPEGFVPRGGINAPDFTDPGSGYPAQSRLLNTLRPAASSHRWVPPLSVSLFPCRSPPLSATAAAVPAARCSAPVKVASTTLPSRPPSPAPLTRSSHSSSRSLRSSRRGGSPLCGCVGGWVGARARARARVRACVRCALCTCARARARVRVRACARVRVCVCVFHSASKLCC